MESFTIYCQTKKEKEDLQKTLRKLSVLYELRSAELLNDALKFYYKHNTKNLDI